MEVNCGEKYDEGEDEDCCDSGGKYGDNDDEDLIVNSDGDDDDVICDKMPDAVWLALAYTTPRLLHHTSSSGSQFHSSFLSAALAALYYTYLCASVSQT